MLQKHKKVTYHFLPIGLLFSGGIKNNTNQTFIVCIGSSDARDSLKNGKSYNFLGVINLECLWLGKIKRTFKLSEYYLCKYKLTYETEHFGFSFKTQNLKEILGFQFTLFDFNANNIESVDGEKKNININTLFIINIFLNNFFFQSEIILSCIMP